MMYHNIEIVARQLEGWYEMTDSYSNLHDYSGVNKVSTNTMGIIRYLNDLEEDEEHEVEHIDYNGCEASDFE